MKLFICLFLLNLSTSMFAVDNFLEDKSFNEIDLEVWTENENRLLDLEKALVNKLNKNKHDINTLFLLSGIYTRLSMDKDFFASRNYLYLAVQLSQQILDIDPKHEFGYLSMIEIYLLTSQPLLAGFYWQMMVDRNNISNNETIPTPNTPQFYGKYNATYTHTANINKLSWRAAYSHLRLSEFDKLSPEELLSKVETILMKPNVNKDLVTSFASLYITNYFSQLENTSAKEPTLSKDFGLWEYSLATLANGTIDKLRGMLKKEDLLYLNTSLAFLLDKTGKEKEAMKLQEKLAMQYPDRAFVHYSLISMYYKDTKFKTRAKNKITNYMEKFEASLSDDDKYYLIFLLSTLDLNTKSSVKNVKHSYSELLTDIKEQPSRDFYLNLMIEEYKQRKLDSEYLSFLNYIKEYVGSYIIYEEMGISYLNNKNYKKALESLQNSLVINPNNSSTLTKIGRIYLALKEYKNARDYFENALKENPMNEDAIMGRHEALVMLSSH